MRLNSIQERFKDLMLDHPKALNTPPSDLSDILETGDISLPDRLKVYRNNIVGSLTDVMVSSFPLIDKLTGREFMEGMARTFILENPPQSGFLNTYGRGFAEFIEGFEPASGLAYLPDVARLEIALNDSYYAADDEPLTAQQLEKVAPESLQSLNLKLRASSYLLHSNFPLTDIREFALSEENPPDLNKGSEHLLIIRPKLDTNIMKLGEAEFAFLENLANNTLGEALQATLSSHETFDIQHTLNKHVQLETFLNLDANIQT